MKTYRFIFRINGHHHVITVRARGKESAEHMVEQMSHVRLWRLVEIEISR